MPRLLDALATLSLATLAACGETPVSVAERDRDSLSVVASVGAPVAASPVSGSPGIGVMTQNLYVGADVDAAIAALATPDPNDDIPALLAAIQTFERTAFAARMEAVAAVIARDRPHVIGLQEVSKVDIDLSSLGLPVVVRADFLPALAAALAARGLHYSVAATVRNIDATPMPGIELVDYDAILVDAERVTVTAAGGRNYADNLGVVAPGVELKRGWVWASAVIDGAEYVFASTHLEGSAPDAPQLLAAQAAELAAWLPGDRPVVVMGDLNDTPGSLMYRTLIGAGFTDMWAELRPGTRGYTCCRPPDLSDKMNGLTKRIDYVLARGLARPGLIARGEIALLGDTPASRLRGPAGQIWPSDHAGLVTKFFSKPLAPQPMVRPYAELRHCGVHPPATGRWGSVIHSLQEPRYSRVSPRPASSAAKMSCAAVIPEPQ